MPRWLSSILSTNLIFNMENKRDKENNENNLINWPNCYCGARSVTVTIVGYLCQKCFELEKNIEEKGNAKQKQIRMSLM